MSDSKVGVPAKMVLDWLATYEWVFTPDLNSEDYEIESVEFDGKQVHFSMNLKAR